RSRRAGTAGRSHRRVDQRAARKATRLAGERGLAIEPFAPERDRWDRRGKASERVLLQRLSAMTAVPEAAYAPATSGALAGWIGRNGPVLAVFGAIFALWEIAVRALGIPDYILPSPSVIIIKIVATWQLLLWNAFVTLEEILLGFGLSVLIAIPLAVAVV